MVQDPISHGLYFWNDKNKQSGFDGFSVSEDLHNSMTAAAATDYGYLDFDESEADHKRIRLMGSNQQNEGELVAKCYYAKRKLVWEVLDKGLKSKIEIQWSDISAIRAVFPENGPGILEIELSTAPLFFKEMNPQPRKHTLWQTATDFTGGQAPTYRRHYLHFPEGTLEKHYQKLLQCDNRLFMLSQRPFPSSNSQFFQPNLSGYPDFYLNFNGHQPTPMLQYPLSGIQRPTLYPSHQVQKFHQTIRPPTAPRNQVSQLPGIQQQRTSFSDQRMTNEEIIYRSRGGNQVQELPPLIATINQVHPFLPRYDSSELNSFGNCYERLNADGWELNNIVNHLFDEPIAPACSNDQRVLAKIRSMNCLLEAAKEQNQIDEKNPCLEYTDYSYGENMNISEPTSTDQSYGNGELSNTDQSNRDFFMGLQRNPLFSYLNFEPSLHNVENVDPGMMQTYWEKL
ncbi:hypothetical protein BVC80_1543g259 [Macleaya cordata]|uniref:TRF2/HOY1 PH-like domain-containing protein n=1 Tax=Macleaya cordata TaxID=56857 RepID=A0A200R278_MACCD|nr:hypothetical protein BVC80_1543g259 [Macleaya cordata]